MLAKCAFIAGLILANVIWYKNGRKFERTKWQVWTGHEDPEEAFKEILSHRMNTRINTQIISSGIIADIDSIEEGVD